MRQGKMDKNFKVKERKKSLKLYINFLFQSKMTLLKSFLYWKYALVHVDW